MTDLSDFHDIQDVIQYVSIDTSSANTTVVAAQSGKSIVVMQMTITTEGESVIRLESGTGGTALTGQMNLYADNALAAVHPGTTGALVLPWSPGGWCKTAISTLLNLELSGDRIGGVLAYIVV